MDSELISRLKQARLLFKSTSTMVNEHKRAVGFKLIFSAPSENAKRSITVVLPELFRPLITFTPLWKTQLNASCPAWKTFNLLTKKMD